MRLLPRQEILGDFPVHSELLSRHRKCRHLEVLRRLRADPHGRRQPVVVLTNSKEEQDLVSSYDLGANSYILKPVDFDRFTEAVRHLGLYWLLLNEPPPNG